MKNSTDLGDCYPPRPSALVDNTLLDLQNSSYPTQPHSIIANYTYFLMIKIYALDNLLLLVLGHLLITLGFFDSNDSKYMILTG